MSNFFIRGCVKRTPYFLLLAAFSMPSGAQQAQAEVEEAKTLEEMTVRHNRPAAVVAGTNPMAEVTAEQIRDMNVISTEDTLRYVPSLNIRQRYTGDRNAVISARTTVGTTPSASSLVYADGLLLSNLLGNSYGFPPRWNLVGVSEIDTVDVLYGPFSVLLPGNSAGATVFITTRRPEQAELHVSAQAMQQKFSLYGTNDSFNTTQLQASGGFRLDDWRVSLLLNHLDAHGQPMSFATGTPVKGAGSKAVSGFYGDAGTMNEGRAIWGAYGIDHTIQDTGKIKLEYDFSRDTRASVTFAEFRNDSDSTAQSYLNNADGSTYWGTVSGQKFNVGNGQFVTVKASDFGRSKQETTNRLWGLSFASRLDDQWRVEAIATDYSTPQDINRAATNGVLQGNSGVGTITYGDDTGWHTVDLRAIWKSDAEAPGHIVTAGFHYDEFRYNSTKYDTGEWLSNSTTTLNMVSRGKTQTTAVYVQDAWKFLPEWTLTSGVRQENWGASDGYFYDKTLIVKSKDFAARDGNYTSPKATMAWQATADWQLRASLARAYRMPTVTELYGTATSATGQKYIADGSLLPEKIRAADLTAEGAVAGGILRISLFQENKDDYILSQRNAVTNVTALMNIDQTKVQGAELVYSGNDILINGLDFQGSVTYTDGTIIKDATHPEYEGRPLAIPRWRATAFAAYRFNENWSASAGIRSSTYYPDLNPAVVNFDLYGASSGFTVADARVNYRFDQHATLSLGVNNIGGDKAFAYHPYPQRTVQAQLKVDF